MKTLLSAICGLCLLTSSGQEIPFQIKKSAVFKDEYKNSMLISVDEDNSGGTIVVRSYSGGTFSAAHGYYFERYNSEMTLVRDFEYELKKGYVMGIFVNNDKVNIVEWNYIKDEKTYVCSVNTANINDFKFSTKELFRLEKDQVRVGSFSQMDDDNMASLLLSEDKSAFAISVDIVDKMSETHKLYSFDENLIPKIEHTFKRDIKDRKFKYENIDVSKDGSVLYLLGKVYSEDGKKKKDGGKYQYELSRITSSDTKTQVFDTDEHFAAAVKMIFKGDKIGCVGFFSDRKDSRFKGLCYFEMDPMTLEIKTQKFNPFPEQFMIDKYGKNKEKELKNISFRGIFLTAKNEIIFNAEEYYVTTQTTSGMNGMPMTMRYIYHYDDIVSAKLSNTGDIIWARNINKRQSTRGADDYISYTSMAKGSNSYYFINTGEKVKKLRNDRIQFGQTSTQKSNLNVIRTNENGDFDYREILDDKDGEIPFQVANGAISKNGESMYFIGQKGKIKQLLKVTL